MSRSSGASSRSLTRTVARELSTLTPTQASSGNLSMTSFFIVSADQEGQNEPGFTPLSARARRISPFVSFSFPSTSMSQTKRLESASSAKQTASPAISVTRRRSFRLTAGTPRSFSGVTVHWQRAARLFAASRSLVLTAKRKVRSSSGSASQNASPASASRLRKREGSAPCTSSHTLPRSMKRGGLIQIPPRVYAP